MPQLALSTEGLKGDALRQTVQSALRLGYRHFDLALSDGNLRDMGTAYFMFEWCSGTEDKMQ